MALAEVISPRRQESRITVALPIKIFTTEATAPDWSCTYEVSWRGVRLKHVNGIERVGQEIILQRNNRRARYRVTWIGEAQTPYAEQFGADCLEAKVIWDDDLQRKLKF